MLNQNEPFGFLTLLIPTTDRSKTVRSAVSVAGMWRTELLEFGRGMSAEHVGAVRACLLLKEAV